MFMTPPKLPLTELIGSVTVFVSFHTKDAVAGLREMVPRPQAARYSELKAFSFESRPLGASDCIEFSCLRLRLAKTSLTCGTDLIRAAAIIDKERF